ncbi:MAG TPA: ATP-dependent DNA helicase [Acidiferrobacteraceae bacterium]|nr:ATP-dependent DNA helicase [Acidiferrobacteraceae bacterium]
MEQNSADLLTLDGPFADLLEGFTTRDCQQQMAASVERVLADGGSCVIESGTGTGKTFAYLVPALLSGKKVLVSTGTKNLQDQLFHRDLPIVRKAVGVPVTTALLKGRANYLCIHRLGLVDQDARYADELAAIRKWARQTHRGDIAEVRSVAEGSPIWSRVTSTAENCLGAKCDDYDECHVKKARQSALAADVLVVNHHLFFADLALKEEGFGQLLPGFKAVIFDEAHQLPEIASDFFGVILTGYQLQGLCRDIRLAEVAEKSGIAELIPRLEALEKAIADFRLTLGEADRRAAWASVEEQPAVQQGLAVLKDCLGVVSQVMEVAAAAGEALGNVWQRTVDLNDRLEMITSRASTDYVAWFETHNRNVILRLTPVDVASAFRERRDNGDADRAWVYTSATLAVNGSFDFFQARLGLEDAQTELWDSPFDFQQQALLYIPQGLPQPFAPDYTQALVDTIVPVLEASGGRAFVLFTSHRALREVAQSLPQRIDFPVLVQGTAPRSQLLTQFRDTAHGVLLGTGSFWEGVDVRGEALSCVIIDKLPFASPADPVLQARGAAMEAEGRNPFFEYQVPNAVISLKQGVGRLIRGTDDRGLLVLCDPRLLTKSYGKYFMKSLPDFPVTRELADVQAFFVE